MCDTDQKRASLFSFSTSGLMYKRASSYCSLVACAGLDFFFFSSRRRHTRFDCDWSSDVCSSDLNWPGARLLPPSCQKPAATTPPSATAFTLDNAAPLPANPPAAETAPEKLGLAGDRKSVV